MKFSFSRTQQLGIGVLCGLIVVPVIISLLVLHHALHDLRPPLAAQQAEKDHFASTRREVTASLQLTSLILTGGAVLTVVAGIGTSLWLSRALSRHIGQIRHAAQELGKGNLAYRINSLFTDPVGQLAAGVDDMAAQLNASTHHLNTLLAELTEARNVSECQTREVRAGSEALSSEIAERQRTEEALRESEARYRTLIESSVQGLFIHVDGIVCFSNPATARIFGYGRPDELIGLDYRTLVAPHEHEHLESYIQARMRGELAASTYECLGVKQDGSPIWCEYLVSRVLWDDKPAVMSTLLDITTRKQAELALQDAKEAAESASKAQQGFLANMSHELRTPLHAILSYSAFGLKKAATASPEKLHQYFSQIDQSSKSLLTLLNDLLDLAKFEAGKMSFTFETVDLNILLVQVAEEFQAFSDERSLQLNLQIPDAPARLSVDTVRIMQVLRNLVSNAIKFTTEGRTVTLRLERQERSVQVSVSDQGPGIPEAELETVFDKFVQSSQTATGAGGTGLGLAICREIISEHAGRIWAANQPEGGVRFAFELPMPQDEVLTADANQA